jgi:hypothetical protein
MVGELIEKALGIVGRGMSGFTTASEIYASRTNPVAVGYLVALFSGPVQAGQTPFTAALFLDKRDGSFSIVRSVNPGPGFDIEIAPQGPGYVTRGLVLPTRAARAGTMSYPAQIDALSGHDPMAAGLKYRILVWGSTINGSYNPADPASTYQLFVTQPMPAIGGGECPAYWLVDDSFGVPSAKSLPVVKLDPAILLPF